MHTQRGGQYLRSHTAVAANVKGAGLGGWRCCDLPANADHACGCQVVYADQRLQEHHINGLPLG